MISFIPHRIPAALDRSVFLKQDTIDVPIHIINVSENDVIETEMGLCTVFYVENELSAFIRCDKQPFLMWLYDCFCRVKEENT
jgi:hypothetical protein